MAEKVFRQDQIIARMREAEVLFRKGLTIEEVSRRLVISKQTCCLWREQFAGMWFRPGS